MNDDTITARPPELKWVVSAVVGYLLLVVRSTPVVVSVAGSLMNTFSTNTLKRFIRQSRPSPHEERGYGMPSNHAASVAYLATAGLCVFPEATFWNTAFICLGVCIAALKVIFQEHSLAQVVAGAVHGVAFSLAWNILVTARVPVATVPIPAVIGMAIAGASVVGARELFKLSREKAA